jgi:hypothetical protein
VRIEEHQKKVKNGKAYGSKLGEHVLETEHNVLWEDSWILYKECNWRKKRNIAESLFMNIENNPISRPSVDVSQMYVQVVRNEIKTLSDRVEIETQFYL